MTTLYVWFFISLVMNTVAAFMVAYNIKTIAQQRDRIYRLEDICRRRQNHINEVSQMLHELKEDEEHDHRSDPLAYTTAKNVHSAT